jgi:peroxiredoxin
MVRDIGKWLATVALIGLALPGLARAIEVGESAPDFTLTDLQEIPHSLSTCSSNAVLLMFFSCTEGSSRAVAPLVQVDLYDEYTRDELTILGIDCLGGTAEQMSQFWHETRVEFPLLMDGGMTQAIYGIEVLGLVVIDSGGTVRYVSSGQGGQAYDRESLVGIVDLILSEANSSKEATWGLIKGLYVE